ncbi:MAG: zinc-ribbon domain-containing protein [Saccharofermentans sp.]|nr:zinc-ribbon domain-containing protein [Saccharofermentans sp.]
MKYCTKCGMRLADSSKFCSKCGTPFSHANSDYFSFRAPEVAGEASLGAFGSKGQLLEGIEDTEEPVSAFKSLLFFSGSFFKGIGKLFTKPRNLIAVILIIFAWIGMNLIQQNTSFPMEIPSSFLYAQGGFERYSIAGVIGGIFGRGVVAALIITLLNGGFKRIGQGFAAVFKSKGNKHSIVFLIIGTVISLLFYFLLVGFTQASIFTSIVGFAGALLSLQALGKKESAAYGLARSVTGREGRVRSLLTGFTLGSVIAAFISVLLTPRVVLADENGGKWVRVDTIIETRPETSELSFENTGSTHSIRLNRGVSPASNDDPKESYYLIIQDPVLDSELYPGKTYEMACYSYLESFSWYAYNDEVSGTAEWPFTAEEELAHLDVIMSGDSDAEAGILREVSRHDFEPVSSVFVNYTAGAGYTHYWVRGSGYIGGSIEYEFTVPEGKPGNTMTVVKESHFGDVRTSWVYEWVEPGAEISNTTEYSDPIEEDVTTPADIIPGEDRGTDIDPDIVEGDDEPGLPEDAALAGGGALVGGGLAGIIVEDDKKKKKKKTRSGYRMNVNKNFGNTLKRGGKEVMVYARIAELPAGKDEVSRDDLTSMILVFSGDGVLQVKDGGMVNGYKCAIVKVPDDCTAAEGSVSFRYVGTGGTFTRHVVFNIVAGQILFPQENLGLPACKLKYVRMSEAGGTRIGNGVYILPFCVKGMPPESRVKAVFERVGSSDMNGKYIDKSKIDKLMPYTVTVEPDKEYGGQGIYNALIRETGDYELNAGINEGFALKVTAECGTAGQPGYDIATGVLPVFRIHLGLALSVQGKSIPCYVKLKPGRDGKSKDELVPEDYEIIYAEASLMLFLCDEKTLSVIRIPVNPEKQVKVTPTKVANDRYCRTGDANASHQQLIDKLAICAFPTGQINENGSHRIRICPTGGWMDPPTRILADIEISAKYQDRIYTVVRNVLLRSQDFRVARNAADDTAFLNRDKHITEQLVRISTRISNEYPLNLFSLKNMIDRMLEGFDSRFGYDENQVKNVMNMWTGFLEGHFAGANGTPQGVTFADELTAVYAFMQGLRDNTGFLGRVAMGVMTSGVSEYIFTTMTVSEKMREAVFSCKGDKDFGFWDGVEIGVDEFGKQILLELVMQKGMKIVGNTYLSPNVTIADKVKLLGDRYRAAMDSADKYMKENVQLYKMSDDALQSCKNFFNSSARSAKNAIDDTVRSEEDAMKRVEELLKKDRKSLTADELRHEKGMEDGIESVRKLYEAQLEMEAATDLTALKMAKAKYRQIANEVWENKYALGALQRIQHSSARRIRAQFNAYRETLLDEVQLEALGDIAAEKNIRPDYLYVMNASNGSKIKYKTGERVPSDRDISFKQKVLSDRSKDITIDQSVGERAVARRLFKKMNGREADTIEEAIEFMKNKDVTYVNPVKSNADSYVFEHNLEGYEDLAGMTGIKVDGSMDKTLMKNDLHNKVINQTSVKEKGVEWFRRSNETLRSAMEKEVKAASMSGEAREVLLEQAEKLRIKAQRHDIEGVYQITKQVDNIIIPRGILRTGKNPVPPEAMNLHELALKVSRCEVSPARFKSILRENYNMDLNGYAEYMSKLLD